MARLRQTGNMLDRNTREDINYNWKTIDALNENVSNSVQIIKDNMLDVNSQLLVLEKEISEYDKEIAKLHDRIDLIDVDNIGDIIVDVIQKGITAQKQGNHAELQGNRAEHQGLEAKKQGDIAQRYGIEAKEIADLNKQWGSYAKEKGEFANKVGEEVSQANKDLTALKTKVEKATLEAKTQADKAEQNNKIAEPLIHTMQTNLPNITNLVHTGLWSNTKEYFKNMEVEHKGSTYRAKKQMVGYEPKGKTDESWILIAKAGIDGKGTVQSVNGVFPDENGNIEIEATGGGGNPEHETKIASTNELGHIMVGHGLTIDSKGVLSVTGFDIDDTEIGSKGIIAGSSNAGFMGEVPQNELFTMKQLEDILPVSEFSKATTKPITWLKFVFKGETFYSPKAPLVTSLTFKAIREANLEDFEITKQRGMRTFAFGLWEGWTRDFNTSIPRHRYSSGSDWNSLILPLLDNARTNQWKFPEWADGVPRNWMIGYEQGEDFIGDQSIVTRVKLTDRDSAVTWRNNNGNIEQGSMATSAPGFNEYAWLPVIKEVKG